MAKFILRFDDYCSTSNTAVEQGLLEAVAACNGRIVMSVVPFVAETDWELRGPIPLRPLTAEKAELLKRFVPRYAEVALHGYSHQTVTRWSHLLEFGDRVSRQRQVDRLRDGRAFLEDVFGVKVETFVPPWNEYGKTTLLALEEAGFKVVAGELALGPAEGNLAFIPSCCGLNQFENAIATAGSDPDAVVCVNIHEYDFKESGWPHASTDIHSIGKMNAVLARNNGVWIICNENFASGEWAASRLIANRELRKAFTSPVRRFFANGTSAVYWSAAAAAKKTALLDAGNPRRWLRQLKF